MWGYPHIPVGRRVERPTQCRPGRRVSQVAAPTAQCAAQSWLQEYISGELLAFQLSSWELFSRSRCASQAWSAEKTTNKRYDESGIPNEAPGGRSQKLAAKK